MIDVLTGIITLNVKTSVIRPDLTRGEFETSDLFGEVISTQRGLYTSYMIDAQTVGDKEFALALLFNEAGIVDSVHMNLSSGHERPTWDQWGELDAQRRRKTTVLLLASAWRVADSVGRIVIACTYRAEKQFVSFSSCL